VVWQTAPTPYLRLTLFLDMVRSVQLATDSFTSKEEMMKSLMLLSQVVAQDLGNMCGTSTIRDQKTIAERFEHEGLSFLTITLANFGKDFQKSLERGKLDRDLFTGFSFRGKSPAFMAGFFDLVFDRNSGILLESPSSDAIFAIRQLTGMFAKVALPCSPERVKAALDQYVQTDNYVSEAFREIPESLKNDFSRIADLLYWDVFRKMDRDIHAFDILPKHGPGKTADRLTGNGKYGQTEWTDRLEEIFPAGDYLLPSPAHYGKRAAFTWLEPGDERPVKVTVVPKTLKTPRIIAIEPTCMQYVQQGILDTFLKYYGEDDLLPRLIGFDDQVPNQELAKQGSLLGDLATLDLSEASDRVSNQLVRLLFSPWQHIAAAVDASRSRKADVPGYGTIRISKYASMGSALCFSRRGNDLFGRNLSRHRTGARVPPFS